VNTVPGAALPVASAVDAAHIFFNVQVNPGKRRSPSCCEFSSAARCPTVIYLTDNRSNGSAATARDEGHWEEAVKRPDEQTDRPPPVEDGPRPSDRAESARHPETGPKRVVQA
jgi:hypothetical protein